MHAGGNFIGREIVWVLASVTSAKRRGRPSGPRALVPTPARHHDQMIRSRMQGTGLSKYVVAHAHACRRAKVHQHINRILKSTE